MYTFHDDCHNFNHLKKFIHLLQLWFNQIEVYSAMDSLDSKLFSHLGDIIVNFGD